MSARALGSLLFGLCCWSVLASSVSDLQAKPPVAGDPANRDAVLAWNAIALQAVVDDHTLGMPEQGGPTRTSRALAIVHAAMFDAVNSIVGGFKPYAASKPAKGYSLDAAVAQAAHDTLSALYPNQSVIFAGELSDFLAAIPKSSSKSQGSQLGAFVAKKILKDRKNDGSDDNTPYVFGLLPGDHREDPLNPGQGFLTPNWGSVTPFGILSGDQFQAPAPPALDSPEYTAAYNDVKDLGGDGIITPTVRTDEQTAIGLYWAYDGARFIGVPPRLYNQIVRVIAIDQGNTEVENARLFALVNIAMADAGIASWETKYAFNFWRPILGIRESDPGTGPSGLGDGNDDTVGDPNWTPLGAPASNESNGGNNFTPPFPAYTSGHATFGAATFRTLANFYGTDNIGFTFTSDELNGINTDNNGNPRPAAVLAFGTRSFPNLTAASVENARSRIYLGIHWQFDADEGIITGNGVADEVFENVLTPQ